MKNKNKIWPLVSFLSAFLISLLVVAPPSLAQTTTWNGGNTPGNWSDATKWTGGVPTSTSNTFIDGGQITIHSSVTVDIANAVTNNLTLDNGDALTIGTNNTLTVGGTVSLNGSTGINFGTLTLNGSATNDGTITLQTNSVVIAGHRFILNIGTLNGSGSLNNTLGGIIQGAGNIFLPLTNSGAIIANDSSGPLGFSANIDNTGGTINGDLGGLVLNGTVITGGTVGGAVSASNGAALNNAVMGGPDFSLNAGSTLGIQGNVTVASELILNNGVTLSGSGTLQNPLIKILLPSGDSAAISANILGGPLTNVGTLQGGSSGGTLTLNGNTISNNSLNGQFQANGVTLNQDFLGDVTLLPGSTATVGGTLNNVGGALTLGDGVSLSGHGDVDNSIGVIRTMNPGDSAAIALAGGIFTTGSRLGTILGGFSGGTLTLDGTSVSDNFLEGQFATRNGVVFNNDTIQTGTPVTLTANSSATIQSFANLGVLTLGGNVTLSGAGFITNGTGATIQGGGSISATIANSGGIFANNSSSPLTLLGNVTNPNGTGIVGATNGGTLVLDTVTLSASSVNIDASSALRGTGTINVSSSGQVTNLGVLAPGSATTPGTLTINGTYAQASGAIVDFLLAGGHAGQYSVLDINHGLFVSDTGGIVEADFASTFDPSADCGATFGVCDTFDVLDVTNGDIDVGGAFGITGLVFDLPTLPTGFEWAELDLNGDTGLELQILGMSSGGGGGGGGGTPTPEPASFLLMGGGILAAWRRARRTQRLGRGNSLSN